MAILFERLAIHLQMWYNIIKAGEQQMSVEQLISEVNGSMAIEGMTLTENDKSRIRRCLENPDEAARILQELISKHQKPIVAKNA